MLATGFVFGGEEAPDIAGVRYSLKLVKFLEAVHLN